ncbi:hypothetical protein GRX03_04070 [Halovenus sp. WSH3]|uniref:Uncharacterized protein n=1 Tax=Halovenus carboxidivorans TaxID=2692199 RepID=A0A6B0T682_9EURY|nr:hypothetical protein [Halovenus carboxidivorans]MXR50782.1 hypothetical protein [Halovenus carboxidivorans]
MPVNLRPPEWFYERFGMYTLFESITTRSRHRENPETAVEHVAEQTASVRREGSAAGFLESLNLVPALTPVGVKRRSPELLRGPGEGLVDTVMLSNLGRVPEFEGTGAAATLWFSPPSWKPTPVSIGVVTVGDEMSLVLRHMRDCLDDDAACRFASLFETQLRRVVR